MAAAGVAADIDLSVSRVEITVTIEFAPYGEVNQDSSDKTLYGDIVRHCKDWQHFADASSKYTTAHECTHGINNDLRLASGDWDRKNGFYVGQGRSIILDEPPIKKADIIPFIPASLRSVRYSLYVAGQSEWNDKPLYIYDEGVAYVNGAWAAIELKEAENYVEAITDILPSMPKRKHPLYPSPLVNHGPSSFVQAGATIVDGQIEFITYMAAVLMAANKAGHHDQRLLDFSRWLFRHASNAYFRSKKDGFPAFDVQDKLWNTLKSGTEATEMRNFLQTTVGYVFPDGEIPEDDDPNPPWYV